MKSETKKKIWPMVAALAVWLVCCFALPVYRVWAILISLAAAALAWGAMTGVFAARDASAEKARVRAEEEARLRAEEAKKPKLEKSYGPDIDPVLLENLRAQGEFARLRASIPSETVKEKITKLMELSDKIAKDAIDDPADLPQIRKFQGYYIPTTLKLLNNYDRMASLNVGGDNISGTMQTIESMLDTTVTAYSRQLDSLFADQALDIETDIQVMNTMMRRQGLMDDDLGKAAGGAAAKLKL